MNTKKPRGLVAAVVVVVSVLLALAGRRGDSVAPKTRPGTPEAPWVIGVSQCNLGEPWRVQMNRDIQRAAEAHPNIKVLWRDAQNDSQRQRAQVGELLSQRIDLLIISPREAAPLTEPVAEVFRSGIPVIVLDRAVEGNEFTTFIGADNKRIGREAGAWATRALEGRGKIVELTGLMTSTPGQDRSEGFAQGLNAVSHSRVDVVFAATMNWLEQDAKQQMESVLATHADIDLVYAHNDPGAHGAYLAARAAGREKQIRFIGVDGMPQEGIEYLKQGILDATFLYPTGGAEAIATALTILGGEAAPKTIVLKTRIFTRDNAERGGDEIR